MQFSKLALLAVLAALSGAQAGPITYGACQGACFCILAACYGTAGFTFGAIPPAAPPAIAACNAAFFACSGACSNTGWWPTP
ncbi:hypothetical protein AB1N83_012442 [Pleurotus pulmonarius]